MRSILLALLLQSLVPAGQSLDSQVSLDRVREGLLRPGQFQAPPPQPTERPLFRIRVEERSPLAGEAWDETSLIPPWIRPAAPPVHYEFLKSVTPEEFRSSTLHPCCDVLPLVKLLSDAVSDQLRAARQARAKREVENAMRAAGIQP
jgi:hypothetical protein